MKTLARARNNAYWPGLAHDVLKLCRNVKSVLKIMLIRPFHHHLTVKLTVQDLNTVLILGKLMDTHI